MRLLTAISDAVKRRLYRSINISYNPYGVPFALAKHMEGQSAISVVDVGAHAGEFTRALDLFCHINRGLLIEAQPNRAKELALNFPRPRFEVAAVAVTDHSGEIDLQINNFDPTTSILETLRDKPQLAGYDVTIREIVRCPLKTLDSLVTMERFPVIDLLKLDVQGAELLVIRGAQESLKRTRIVWTEVSFTALYGGAPLFHELHAELNSLGFELKELESGFRGPSGELLQADALFHKQ